MCFQKVSNRQQFIHQFGVVHGFVAGPRRRHHEEQGAGDHVDEEPSPEKSEERPERRERHGPSNPKDPEAHHGGGAGGQRDANGVKEQDEKEHDEGEAPDRLRLGDREREG